MALLLCATTFVFLLHFNFLPQYLNFVGDGYSAVYYISVRFLMYFFSCGIYPLIDSIVLKYFDAVGKDRSCFGEERMYGAMGWGVSHIILGKFIDIFGYNCFAGFAVTYLIVLLIMLHKFVVQLEPHTRNASYERCNSIEMVSSVDNDDQINTPDSIEEIQVIGRQNQTIPNSVTKESDSGSGGVTTLIHAFCATPLRCSFFTLAIALVAGSNTIESLSFLYFFHGLGASNFLCGLSVGVTVLFELPAFKYSRFWLETFGTVKLMMVASICFCVRVTLYAFSSSGMMILLLQPLHGITFAFGKTAAVEYVHSIAPEGLETTAQGILNSLQRGLGTIIFTAVGGYVEVQYGSHVLYIGASAVVFTGLCFLILTSVFEKNICGKIPVTSADNQPSKV